MSNEGIKEPRKLSGYIYLDFTSMRQSQITYIDIIMPYRKKRLPKYLAWTTRLIAPLRRLLHMLTRPLRRASRPLPPARPPSYYMPIVYHSVDVNLPADRQR